MSTSANFAATPRSTMTIISAANTNRDGTGTIEAAFTAGANGSRVDRIEVKALSSTTAGMVRVFKRVSAGTWRLWREYAISAATPSATVLTTSVLETEIGELMANNTWELGLSTHNAESFAVHIGGGDF